MQIVITPIVRATACAAVVTLVAANPALSQSVAAPVRAQTSTQQLPPVTRTANLSGPRRIKAGAARDHVLGFQAVSGHGEAFTDKAKIDYWQAYLRDVWTEVSKLKQQGVSAENAAKQADLTKHKEHFPTINGPGVPLIAVNRIYQLLDQK